MRVVVTGAAGGLGEALVRAALDQGSEVVACPRVPTTTFGPHPRLRVVPLDLTSTDSIDSAARALNAQWDGIDVLFHNAGQHAHSPRLGGPDTTTALGGLQASALLEMFQVNAIGPLLLTQALEPLLRAGRARIVCVSSRRGSLTDNDDGGNYGYKGSKATLNMFARALAADLAPECIVAAVHPGRIATRMLVGDSEHSPTTAAEALLALAASLTPEQSGQFLRLDGSAHPW